MGLEKKDCIAVIKGVRSSGKLHVDSKQLEFKASDLKWSVQVGKGTSARADGEFLAVRRGSRSASFKVGQNVDRWIDKVLNPPDRARKLGLKDGQKFWTSGKLDSDFVDELKANGLSRTRAASSCDLAFVLMRKQAGLIRFEKAINESTTGTHIWAIWPKGIQEIRQSQVIQKGREHGMGPGKGISFDDELSAMRFTRK